MSEENDSGNSFEPNDGLVAHTKPIDETKKENHDPMASTIAHHDNKMESQLTPDHAHAPSPTNSNEPTISARQRQFEDHINSLQMSQRNKEFRSALFGGRVDIVHRFLVMPDSNTIGPNGLVAEGYTPLQWAAEHCMVDMTHLLLQRGANPSIRDGIFFSPLKLVLDEAEYEQKDDRATIIAKRLIQYLARREVDTNGRMPLGAYDCSVLQRENGPFLQFYRNCIKEYQRKG